MVEKLHNKKRDDLLDLTGLTMTMYDEMMYSTIGLHTKMSSPAPTASHYIKNVNTSISICLFA